MHVTNTTPQMQAFNAPIWLALEDYAPEIDVLFPGAKSNLTDVAAQIGDPMVRNMGTIGGSLAHADPAAELPAALLALDPTLDAAANSGPMPLISPEPR